VTALRRHPARRLPRPKLSFPVPQRRTVMLWLFAFALRAMYALLAVGPRAQAVSDAAIYDAVAWNLARGAGFSLSGAGGLYPTAFVPPVVPIWVSLVYRAAGHDYFLALLAQCALGAFLPVALAALGRVLFTSGVGWAAGVLASFYPLLVFFNGYLLTETTFTVTVVLALWATAQWVKAPRLLRAALAGALWGLAALTRPTAVLMPIALLPWLWRPLGVTLERRAHLRQVAALLGVTMLCVLPWTLRNAVALHAFVPLTTGGGRSLLDSNNPYVLDDPRLRGNAVSTLGLPPYAGQLAGLSEVEQDRRSARLAMEFLRERWREWPRLVAYKQARFWRIAAERGTTGHWQAPGSPFVAMLRAVDPLALSFGVLLPFILWGTALALHGPRRWYQSLPIWAIAYFALLAAVYWGSLRMRLPAEPLLVLLGALGLCDVRRRLHHLLRGRRRHAHA
jgi:4-amino-4-deoxy-L-arabinose transferase-like glycosyltransferase